MNQEQDKLLNSDDNKSAKPEQKPNEKVGFRFSSSLKITDPATGEVLVQMRAD